jgi:hypothetical protein
MFDRVINHFQLSESKSLQKFFISVPLLSDISPTTLRFFGFLMALSSEPEPNRIRRTTVDHINDYFQRRFNLRFEVAQSRKYKLIKL